MSGVQRLRDELDEDEQQQGSQSASRARQAGQLAPWRHLPCLACLQPVTATVRLSLFFRIDGIALL
jgi:hypothetical protein